MKITAMIANPIMQKDLSIKTLMKPKKSILLFFSHSGEPWIKSGAGAGTEVLYFKPIGATFSAIQSFLDSVSRFACTE